MPEKSNSDQRGPGVGKSQKSSKAPASRKSRKTQTKSNSAATMIHSAPTLSTSKRATKKAGGEVAESARVDPPLGPIKNEAPVAKPPAKLSPLATVYQQYDSAGWTAIVAHPKKGNVDIVSKKHVIGGDGLPSSKGAKYHFVQVITHKDSSTKSTGEQRNAFVQNAFSNAATPVYAFVDEDGTVRYRDANTDKKICL